VELARGGARLVDKVDAGVTFVDGLAVGDVQDVALRDRRRLADDGVSSSCTTLASSDGGEIAPPELISRGFAESTTSWPSFGWRRTASSESLRPST
jgi:ribonuclease J